MPPKANLPRIAVFTTGGTIAMKRDPHSGAAIPAVNGADLVAAIPGMAELARIDVYEVCNLPSDYMGPTQWLSLHQEISAVLADEAVNGAIVTHGTDTLEETAFFLDLSLNSPKPLVVVGAQRNASEPDSDGPRNLFNAVKVASDKQSQGQGVLVVMNNRISAARDVTKSHTLNLAGFQAGDSGYLGYVDERGVCFYRPQAHRQPLASVQLNRQTLTRKSVLARVDIIAMYAGADGGLFDAALTQGAAGIVVQALGAGNVNRAFYQAIQRAIAQGVVVVIATRVPDGRIAPVYGYEGGGQTLLDAGAILAGELSPQKARIVLMLALQQGLSGDALQAHFY